MGPEPKSAFRQVAGYKNSEWSQFDPHSDDRDEGNELQRGQVTRSRVHPEREGSGT